MILLNNKQIYPTYFPDNTTQVWKIDQIIKDQSITQHIEWFFDSESEAMHLMQLQYLLKSKSLKSQLIMPYLPYGRQDKEIGDESTFALYPFADFINSLAFEKVLILDPHNPKLCERLFRRYEEIPIEDNQLENEYDVICFPDKGAFDRYKDRFKGKAAIYGSKTRERKTGKIINISIEGDCKGKSVLMVDDICDGGATFIKLHGLLIENGATKTGLFVTHGIFSNGLEPLKKSGISEISAKHYIGNYTI
jgi:ribose-phosphate pyrophosphokinase